MKRIALVAAALVSTTAVAAPAHAAGLVVKEYQTRNWNTGIDNENTVAKVAGTTFGGQVASAADLNGTSIVIAGGWNAFLRSWVSNGGFLIMHDWSANATVLPGLSGASYASSVGSDLNVVDPSHPIVTGPGGTITNSTLDGGSSSTHGAFTLSSLNASSDPLAGSVRAILSSGSATSISAFEYTYGSGRILWSAIPLEAYTDSTPLDTGSQPAGLRIYAQNELAYAASTFASPSAVPEPSTWAMMLAGFGVIGFAMRRGQKVSARVRFA